MHVIRLSAWLTALLACASLWAWCPGIPFLAEIHAAALRSGLVAAWSGCAAFRPCGCAVRRSGSLCAPPPWLSLSVETSCQEDCLAAQRGGCSTQSRAGAPAPGSGCPWSPRKAPSPAQAGDAWRRHLGQPVAWQLSAPSSAHM